MPRPYSQDLRVRLIGAVEVGASARLAARLFGVSASTAVKWVARRRRTGSVAAPPMGGSFRSPLDDHEAWILALVNEQPDLTLAAVRGRLRQQGVQAAIGSIWRFFERHGIRVKKNRARRRAGQAGRGRRAPAPVNSIGYRHLVQGIARCLGRRFKSGAQNHRELTLQVSVRWWVRYGTHLIVSVRVTFRYTDPPLKTRFSRQRRSTGPSMASV